MKRADALQKVERIRVLIGAFGGTSEQASREFSSILSSLQSGMPISGDSQLVLDPYYLEKLTVLQDSARMGFSVRKSEGFPGGVGGVQRWAMGALNVVETMIETRWPE